MGGHLAPVPRGAPGWPGLGSCLTSDLLPVLPPPYLHQPSCQKSCPPLPAPLCAPLLRKPG